jgi:membrane protein involved in D-alanine export
VTPFATFLYFAITLYIVVPLLLARVLGFARSCKFWVLGGTLLMLIVQYCPERESINHKHVNVLVLVLGFALLQWLVAQAYLLAQRKTAHWLPFAFSICLSLLPLLITKLTSDAVSPSSHPLGFLGISYITFRCLDTLIGIRDKLVKSVPFLEYICFVLFFPTISAGPIDRYRRFQNDWNLIRDKKRFLEDLDTSVMYLFRGFLYKFLIGAWLNAHWLKTAAHIPGLKGMWLYMYAYSFYLFFDFAGYSAFALSFSYLLGIRTPVNFERPFFAKNIREFWERWHISLSSWFRDHIYMRFLILSTKQKWFKNKYISSYIGYILTMGLMGVWHGFEHYYCIYGLYHAMLLIGYNIFSRWKKSHPFFNGFWAEFLSIVITFHAVCFGFLIFSGRLF